MSVIRVIGLQQEPCACLWSTTPAERMHVIDPLWQHSVAGRPHACARQRWSPGSHKPNAQAPPLFIVMCVSCFVRSLMMEGKVDAVMGIGKAHARA